MIIIKENIFIRIRINLTKYINKIIIYIFLSLDLLKYFIIDKYAYFIETYLIWGLGIGDWGLGPIPNPQSPIPNPQSPISELIFIQNVI